MYRIVTEVTDDKCLREIVMLKVVNQSSVYLAQWW